MLLIRHVKVLRFCMYPACMFLHSYMHVTCSTVHIINAGASTVSICSNEAWMAVRVWRLRLRLGLGQCRQHDHRGYGGHGPCWRVALPSLP